MNIRMLRMMRSSTITSAFALAAIGLTSGCYSLYSVKTPEPPKPEYYAKRLFIDANVDDARVLFVAVTLPATNPVSFAVLPSECSLTDKAKRHYRLELQPDSTNSEPFAGSFQRSYTVRAYGPTPAISEHVFSGGSYDLSVAYTANGERGVIQTPFSIRRFHLPFFIVWGGWLLQGGPP